MLYASFALWHSASFGHQDMLLSWLIARTLVVSVEAIARQVTVCDHDANHNGWCVVLPCWCAQESGTVVAYSDSPAFSEPPSLASSISDSSDSVSSPWSRSSSSKSAWKLGSVYAAQDRYVPKCLDVTRILSRFSRSLIANSVASCPFLPLVSCPWCLAVL